MEHAIPCISELVRNLLTKLFLHLNLYFKSISYYPPVEKNIV